MAAVASHFTPFRASIRSHELVPIADCSLSSLTFSSNSKMRVAVCAQSANGDDKQQHDVALSISDTSLRAANSTARPKYGVVIYSFFVYLLNSC